MAGNKVARTEIAMIKVVAPSMACQVIDWAMQVHGGGGMCDDFPLAYAYANARTLRFADGPDEVHPQRHRQVGAGQVRQLRRRRRRAHHARRLDPRTCSRSKAVPAAQPDRERTHRTRRLVHSPPAGGVREAT